MRPIFSAPPILLAAAILPAPPPGLAAAPRLAKTDRAIQQALNQGATSVRVIIRTPPACRAMVRQSLQAHGDTIVREHASISALTAVLHAGDVAEFDAS